MFGVIGASRGRGCSRCSLLSFVKFVFVDHGNYELLAIFEGEGRVFRRVSEDSEVLLYHEMSEDSEMLINHEKAESHCIFH